LSGSRRCSDESAEIKATFQKACRRPVRPGSVATPQSRLWSEIRDTLDRHGTRAVKADTFPRYRKRPRKWGLFYAPGRCHKGQRGHNGSQIVLQVAFAWRVAALRAPFALTCLRFVSMKMAGVSVHAGHVAGRRVARGLSGSGF
jgi:hypothetical protein